MPSEVKTASKWLLGLASYTGTVVGIWTLPWSSGIKTAVLAILILGAVLVVVTAEAMAGQRRVKELQRENEFLEGKLADAGASDLENSMIALAHTLTEDPLSDSNHHYFEIMETYRLDGNDATYRYRLRGRRVTEGTSAYLAFKVSGDAPADASSLMAEATDLDTHEPLSIAFLRDYTHFKVIQVIFKVPLAKDDHFNVEISLRWNGTFPRVRRRDYLFSTWSHYAVQGIDRLTCKLNSDVEVRNVVLEELRDGERHRSETQPKILNTHGRCEVTWVSSNPSALYLLQFEKVYHS